jgi:hypothetical protein
MSGNIASMSLELTNLTLADSRQVSVKTTRHHVTAANSGGQNKNFYNVGRKLDNIFRKNTKLGDYGDLADTVLSSRGNPAVVPARTLISFNLAASLDLGGK